MPARSYVTRTVRIRKDIYERIEALSGARQINGTINSLLELGLECLSSPNRVHPDEPRNTQHAGHSPRKNV